MSVSDNVSNFMGGIETKSCTACKITSITPIATFAILLNSSQDRKGLTIHNQTTQNIDIALPSAIKTDPTPYIRIKTMETMSLPVGYTGQVDVKWTGTAGTGKVYAYEFTL